MYNSPQHSGGKMIVDNQFVKKLKEFGLNSYEAKIWTALLSRGVSSAGELSDIANVPRSRSYDVLESLEKKGFIIMKLGKPIKYVAIPPEEVLERVKKNISDEAEQRAKLMEELKSSEVLTELNLLHSKGVELIEPTDVSGSFRDRNNAYSQMDLMIREAEKEIVLMTTAEGFTRKTEFLSRSLKKAADRGVNIKIVTQESAKFDDKLLKLADIRTDNKIKARFCIVDGKEILFMINDDTDIHPSFDVGVWVNTPFFASTLRELFNMAWKNMKTLKH